MAITGSFSETESTGVGKLLYNTQPYQQHCVSLHNVSSKALYAIRYNGMQNNFRKVRLKNLRRGTKETANVSEFAVTL